MAVFARGQICCIRKTARRGGRAGPACVGTPAGGRITSRRFCTWIRVRRPFRRALPWPVADAYSQPAYCERLRPTSRTARPWSLAARVSISMRSCSVYGDARRRIKPPDGTAFMSAFARTADSERTSRQAGSDIRFVIQSSHPRARAMSAAKKKCALGGLTPRALVQASLVTSLHQVRITFTECWNCQSPPRNA